MDPRVAGLCYRCGFRRWRAGFLDTEPVRVDRPGSLWPGDVQSHDAMSDPSKDEGPILGLLGGKQVTGLELQSGQERTRWLKPAGEVGSASRRRYLHVDADERMLETELVIVGGGVGIDQGIERQDGETSFGASAEQGLGLGHHGLGYLVAGVALIHLCRLFGRWQVTASAHPASDSPGPRHRLVRRRRVGQPGRRVVPSSEWKEAMTPIRTTSERCGYRS
jgi:hypothetical protein